MSNLIGENSQSQNTCEPQMTSTPHWTLSTKHAAFQYKSEGQRAAVSGLDFLFFDFFWRQIMHNDRTPEPAEKNLCM